MEYAQFEPDTCPFANMLLGQNDPNPLEISQNYHQMQTGEGKTLNIRICFVNNGIFFNKLFFNELCF